MRQPVKEVVFGLRFDGFADDDTDWEEILVQKRFIADNLCCEEADMINMVMQGLTHRQIAKIYGLSRSAVTKRIKKIKSFLMERYYES